MLAGMSVSSHVRVVGQHIIRRDRRVFVRRGCIVHGIRRVVDRGHRDVTVAVSLEVPSEIVYVNESEPLKLAFGV